MRIRIATPQDAPTVNAIYAHYIAHSLATFHESNKTVEERAREMEWLLETYPFLVAEDESGRFLGFANAEPIRPQSGYRFSVELTIYLHPEAPKGRGIGTALYERLLSILTAQGFCTAYAVLYGKNEQSLRLHRRFGFEEAALLKNSAFKQGEWLDTRLLQKALNPYDNPPREPIPFSQYRQTFRV